MLVDLFNYLENKLKRIEMGIIFLYLQEKNAKYFK